MPSKIMKKAIWIAIIATIFLPVIFLGPIHAEDKINIGIGGFDISKADPSEKQVPDITVNCLKKMGSVNVIDLRDKSKPNPVRIKYLIYGAIFKQKDKNFITLRYAHIESGTSVGASSIEYKTRKDAPVEIGKKLKSIEEDIIAKVKNMEKIWAEKKAEQKPVYTLALTGFFDEEFPSARFPVKEKNAKNIRSGKVSVSEIKILDEILAQEIKKSTAYRVQLKEETKNIVAAQKIKPKGPADTGKILNVSRVLRVFISKRNYEVSKEKNTDYYIRIEIVAVDLNTIVESYDAITDNFEIIDDFAKLVGQNLIK